MQGDARRRYRGVRRPGLDEILPGDVRPDRMLPPPGPPRPEALRPEVVAGSRPASGETRLTVSADPAGQSVTIDFGTEVRSITLPRAQAEELADWILDKVWELRGIK